MSKSYRLKCRNPKCAQTFHRYWPREEFEQLQYGLDGNGGGIGCYSCGYPKMVVMLSNLSVDDTFKPGFQRNIREFCSTEKEYNQKLKERGLVEVGYSDIPDDVNVDEPLFTDEMFRVMKQQGLDISDSAIEEYKATFKDS